MKVARLKDIKSDLKNSSKEELLEHLNRLMRFKKDNKELISYLLYESDNDSLFIQSCKEEMEIAFSEIQSRHLFYIRKGVRKILNGTKKNIRYAQKAEIEIELLLHFCKGLIALKPNVMINRQMQNTVETQLRMIRKKITTLDSDLQYDFTTLLTESIPEKYHRIF